MEKSEGRKFTALTSDVECEVKTANEAIDASIALHNHDGHELLLVQAGTIHFYTELGGIRLERGDMACVHELDFHRAELLTLDVYDRIVLNIRSGMLESLSSQKTNLGVCFERNPAAPLNVIHLAEREREKIND